jgi:hypothetical protein
MALMADDELSFKIVRTNGSDEVLARSVNLLLGRAAFETANRMYPNDLLEYRKGAEMLERSREGDEWIAPEPPDDDCADVQQRMF